ncbi:MAG: phosphate ABC transporter permease PstA [Deltaproteobacteria bacterium]|nr:phosphate ABC transporter permease PstA [Deltaproteobacteria bacterium]
MSLRHALRVRRWVNRAVFLFSAFAGLTGLVALVWILTVILLRGLPAINGSFFTELPSPPGIPGGGLANAIVGTLMITALATVIGVTVGIFAGIYLAEFGRTNLFGVSVRFCSDILMSAPSIVIGIFVYTLVVVRTGSFSGYSGALALAIIMLPVVTRTTEEMLKLVPDDLREAALALGAPYWKMTFDVVLRGAGSGIITGVMLAVARVSGETAPLLFTALNSPYWSHSLNEPMANLTVTIFNYAMSPYEDWQTMAWGGALLITFGVLLFTVSARFILGRRK